MAINVAMIMINLLQWKSSHVLFGIVVPKSQFQSKDKDVINNTCSFELRQRATETLQQKVVVGCELKVLSVLRRIVPHCSETDKKGWSQKILFHFLYTVGFVSGEEILKYIEVKREQGIVHVIFKSTPNV